MKFQYVVMILPKCRGTSEADQCQIEDVEHNALYIAEVAIGEPPQTVKLNFDTGSADTWV